ncbi:hypothetical protein OOK36_26715 [Streptomyces sp. NBC_00365]|uniref:hypothetical protein n=1 Tax=Streptomyces sp. NBC_00365 TaxID=2975726 RepID=UPI00224C9F7B|nr:hypothetical protein [Streptomyces sp. NBC_00365]MCX5092406.1 hypothetical protein [Streptomyces sp. NBC_00365]
MDDEKRKTTVSRAKAAEAAGEVKRRPEAAAADTAGTAEPTEAAAPPDSPGSGNAAHSGRPDRAGLLAGAAVLAACSGLILYGVINTGSEGDGRPRHRTPTAAVTYEVTGTGTADLTYQGHSTSGRAAVVNGARLPWHTTVEVPLGQAPTISIVLGEHGGQARCSLAIRGHHVQSATATGTFGRAACAGTLPASGTFSGVPDGNG